MNIIQKVCCSQLFVLATGAFGKRVDDRPSSMSWTKQHCVANITVQSVKLPNEIQDPFQVEWKRSDASGMTEREFANADCDVVFGKRFRFRVKMYIKKKDQTVRPKFVAFTVLRFVDSKQRKVFGTCQVDLSQFYNKPAPIDSTFEIESPHSQKSYLILSAVVTHEKHKRNSLPEKAEDEMDLSEAIQLTTDRQEEWDLSESLTEADKQRINMFFMKRQEEHSRKDALDSFITSPIERRSKHRRALPTRVQSDRDADAAAVQFNSVQPSETSKASLSDFLTGKPKTRARLGRKSLSGLMKPAIDLIPPSAFDDQTLEISPENAAKNLMRSVLNKNWCDSPVPIDEVPKPAVAVYTAMMHTNLLKENGLDNDAFGMICRDIDNRYRTANLVRNITDIDRFVITLYIMSMLEAGSLDADINRVQALMQIFGDICSESAEKIVVGLWTPFQPFTVRLVEDLIDGDTFIRELLKYIEGLKDKLPVCSTILDYFKAAVIECVDAGLVNALIDRPSSCTFMKAATWNAAVTILSSDHRVELPMFKAAISCLTMSQAICSSPVECEALCPGISPAVVMKLLDNQTPDDCMPATNDISGFARHYSLPMTTSEPVRVTVSYEGFQPLAAGIDSSAWVTTKFDEATLSAFKYLNTYFS